MARFGRKVVDQQPLMSTTIHGSTDLNQTGNSLVASAARISLNNANGYKQYQFGNNEWQTEAWRLYDVIGELRFAASWVGSCCSRVRIYVAEVDKNGRVQQEVDESKKPKIAALADTLFGGPTAKSEALRMLGINLTVAGDAFIVGKAATADQPDQWFVVSCQELRRYRGMVRYEYSDGTPEDITDQDIIIRVWTPHPRRNVWADSPTHAALPMLWEIERLTRFVFAQIDSRLVSAGLLPIPKEASFVDDDEEVTGAEALTSHLMRIGSSSLKGEGTAAGVVPTIVEMPTEALGKINLIQFTSELSQQALQLREEAIRRFSLAMDFPPEVLTGTGGSNHWSAWHIEESAVKIHIEPLMTRICDALTTAYLQPALKALKEDPDRYIFWFDTAPLTVRPERLKDTLNLYNAEEGIVSKEAVLRAGDYALSDAPTEDEDIQRFTRKLMLRDPNIFSIPAVRKLAGYTDEMLPPGSVAVPEQVNQRGAAPSQMRPGAGAGPPPPPAPPTGIQPTGPAPLPQGSTAPGAPPSVPGPSPVPGTGGMTAGASVPSAITTFVVANAVALRALEVAGKRLLTRDLRNGNHGVAVEALHTKIHVAGPDHAGKLLAGAWDHLSSLAGHLSMDSVDIDALRNTLDGYCTQRLLSGKPHDAKMLGEALRERGLFDGNP